MQIVEIPNLKLPNKKEEEFLKIDFETFFKKDFKEVRINELAIEGLSSSEDNKNYESILFDISKSFSKEQKVLKIEKTLDKPLIIIHNKKEKDNLNSTSLKIELEAKVKASIIEVFVSDEENHFLVNRELFLKENSSLEYVKIQDLSKDSAIIFNTLSTCDTNANLDIYNFDYSGAFVVNNFECKIEKENVTYKISGLNRLEDKSNNSTLIKTIHNEKNSTSDINYKNTLKDESRAVVKIKSIVNENAPFTKAFQNCNTILLSDDALIFAQPHLEIYIDELEASHGTTTGTLNKEQLYYLCARGISKEEAYNMLLDAFESSIKDSIKDEELKKFVEEYKKIAYV